MTVTIAKYIATSPLLLQEKKSDRIEMYYPSHVWLLIIFKNCFSLSTDGAPVVGHSHSSRLLPPQTSSGIYYIFDLLLHSTPTHSFDLLLHSTPTQYP